MKHILLLRRWFLLSLAAAVGVAHAEFVYQPQGYGASTRKWRAAGSDLYDGIKSVKEGLRLIEEGEREQASLEAFKSVSEKLGRARQRYAELSKEIEKPRATALGSLAPSQAAAIVGRYHMAGVRMPRNEAEAADLAAQEIGRFLDAFKSLLERIASQLAVPPDKRRPGLLLAIAQELKRICDRLEDLGLNTAELLTTLPPS